MTKIPSPYKYKKIFWGLAVTCSFMMVFYLSLVGKTVANVVERQNNEKAIAEVTARVSQFEFAYLNEKASINASLARDLGFVEVAGTSVAKDSTVSSLPSQNALQ